MDKLFNNYFQMVSRVDALCQEINDVLAGLIVCSEGCSSCCKSITLFPVEAAVLNATFESLPYAMQEEIRRHVTKNSGGECCPLLKDDRCLLYNVRPIICRTHGLPIIYTEGVERKIDCCPLNLNDGGQVVSGSAIIDLDRLNTILVAVNAHFLSLIDTRNLPERLTIIQALKVGP